MQKQAPSITQLVIIAGFTLSCFGLLLFLWISFGGPTPLKAKGYTLEVPLKEAGQLAEQSDVRISGVSVGKVTGIELGSGKDAGSAVATIELNNTYAPVPENTRAMLRQKTLLGETYVELTPGDRNDPNLPDGGELPSAQVAPSVELDEILRTFNARTRVAFQNWMADAAVAFRGRGQGLNAALGLLEPTLTDADKVVRVLDTQRVAVRQFVRNTGVVLNALTARQGQLQGLIRNSNAVFQTTARRNQDLRALFLVLPTFLDESRLTLNRLDRFAANANPLITQLRPAARNLAPVLKDTGALAPILRDFLIGLKPVIRAAPHQFPALRKFLLQDLPPYLGRLDPFFQELDPLLQAVGLYKRELAGFLGNSASATERRPGKPGDQRTPGEAAADRGAAERGFALGLPAAAARQPRQPLPQAQRHLQPEERRDALVRDEAVLDRDQRDPARLDRAQRRRAVDLHRRRPARPRRPTPRTSTTGSSFMPS